MNILILLLASTVLSVLIGVKTKSNIGIAGLFLAFLNGMLFFKKTPGEVIGLFPTPLFFTMFIVSFFYGYASENHALERLSQWMIYHCRTKLHILPFFLFLITAFISATGAGAGVAPAIMAPIAFTLIEQVGFPPIMAVLSVNLGALCGGIQPWTSSGALFFGVAETYLGTQAAFSSVWSYGLVLLIVPPLFFIILYLWYCKKHRYAETTIPKPEPFQSKHKLTLWIVLLVMVLVTLPVFLKTVFQLPLTDGFSRFLDIRVLCTFGILLHSVLHTGNIQNVIAKHIPWSTIIMVCGMSTLIELFVETGVSDIFGTWLGSSINPEFLIPIILLFGGLLSFITTGPSVIFPLFMPMFSSLSSMSNISIAALTTALFAGVGAAGMSPFSQGGAMALSGCKSEQIRESLWKKQLLCSVLFLGFYILISFTGLFSLVAGLYK